MAITPLNILDPTPDPKAFQGFQAAVDSLAAAVDRAATAMVADEREMLAERLRDGRTAPSALMLTLAAEDCSWTLPGQNPRQPGAPAGDNGEEAPPSGPSDARSAGATTLEAAIGSAYYEWKTAVAQLRQANRQLQDYAGILVRLADPKALSPAETAELERKLNILAQSGLNLGAGNAVGGFDSQAERQAAAGLLSMAATDLFRIVLRQHRGTSLEQAVAANDAPFRRHAEALRAVLRELHGSLRCHYINDSCDLLAAWDPDKAATPAKKLLALNDNTLERLEAIAAILAILETLPAAHASLTGSA